MYLSPFNYQEEKQMAAVAESTLEIRGDVVQPGDDSYAEACAVYNAMIDKKPALIAQCDNAGDVMAAVNYGREQGLDIAIRGGGHNGGGLGTVDDGLVIDLSRINYVRVDPTAKTVRVGGGATWGDVDAAAWPFGLVVPAGIISTTGVGGLTLGGGMGHLTRKYGLTIDNLLSADMVLADGSFVTVDEDNHPDLFWAIRGGGGNFGVVTSFLFRGREQPMYWAGPMLWELEHTKDVMQWYREFMPAQADEIGGWFAFVTVPGPPFPDPLHGKKMASIMWTLSGTDEQNEAALNAARDAAPVAFDHVGPAPHPVWNSMFDPLYPPGHQWYWKADIIDEIPDAAIEEHIRFAKTMPTPQSSMHMYPIDGAAGRVGADETAWAYRDAKWSTVFVGVDPDPANNDKLISWARDYWEALHPYSAGGAYVNFMMADEGQDRVQASYRHNYDRLVDVKTKYDPNNVFHVNQNIKPRG
jgi:FAD/FMN-containing dehydrogenase